jgi:hypothetical protein
MSSMALMTCSRWRPSRGSLEVVAHVGQRFLGQHLAVAEDGVNVRSC